MNQAKPTLMKENILIAVMCLLYPVIPVQGQQRDSTMQTRQFKTHYSREIYGMVVDDTGEPLTGATITSVGEDGNRATTMAVTDVNGHFMMSLGEDTRALEVSFIGFKPRRIALTRESSYKIELQPDSKSVGEVVVNGAFTRKANTFTGAVTTVSGDDLSRVGNQNCSAKLEKHRSLVYADREPRSRQQPQRTTRLSDARHFDDQQRTGRIRLQCQPASVYPRRF